MGQIEALLPTRALVIVHGPGGSGKSVALWQVATEATTFVALTRAIRVPPAVVAARIADWGHLPASADRRGELLPLGLERLAIANPGQRHPILYLGLDALDEAPRTVEQQALLADMITWFWQEDGAARRDGRPPWATLIVTCRDPQEIADLWLDLPPLSHRRAPCLLPVGDFSLSELLAVAQRQIAPALVDQLWSAIAPLLIDRDRTDYPDSLLDPFAPGELGGADPLLALPLDRPSVINGGGPRVLQAVSPATIDALRHPAMWAALETLTEVDHVGVIAGEPAAIGKLASAFLTWWVHKVQRRDRRDHRWDDGTLWAVLSAVAHATRQPGPNTHTRALCAEARSYRSRSAPSKASPVPRPQRRRYRP